MNRPIIRSLLDTDLYKFTMLQVVLHQFPQAHGVYEFRCRNYDETVYPLIEIHEELERELDALCELQFTQDELDYLRGMRFIKSDFVDYLELFQLKRRFVKVFADEQNRLSIRVEGPMIQAMFFEIYILAMVNELYFRRLQQPGTRIGAVAAAHELGIAGVGNGRQDADDGHHDHQLDEGEALLHAFHGDAPRWLERMRTTGASARLG